MVLDVASSASSHRNAQRLGNCPPQRAHRDIPSGQSSDTPYQGPAENRCPPTSTLQTRGLSNPSNIFHPSSGRRMVSVATSVPGSNHQKGQHFCRPIVSQSTLNNTFLTHDPAPNGVQNSHDRLTLPSSIGKPPAMHAPSSSSSSQANKPKHMCKVCGKVFKRAHNLKIHGRLHNGDRPYGCPFPNCNKEFRWKSSIVSHVNWHRTKRGDTLPPDAIVVQKTTSRRQLAPFLKPSTTNIDSKGPVNEENKKSVTKDCVGFMPRCLKAATASTSSSDGTDHRALNPTPKTGRLEPQGSVVIHDASGALPFSAISSNLEMQFAREQPLAPKKTSNMETRKFPAFEDCASPHTVRGLAQSKEFSAEDDGNEDFVDQLVERNLTLGSPEEMFIDEYVNGDVHGRLDMGFHSSMHAGAMTGEMKSPLSEEDIIGEGRVAKVEESIIVTPSTDSFEIFPNTRSAELEEGTLEFFENEEWGERSDTAATEGLMAGMLLHPGCRVDHGAELLTGSLEEEI